MVVTDFPAQVDIEPGVGFIDPCLVFKVSFRIGAPIWIFSAAGLVYVWDSKFRSLSGKLGVVTLDPSFPSAYNPEVKTNTLTLQFLLPLTQRKLNVIEEYRFKNPNNNPQHDVYLNFEGSIGVSYMKFRLLKRAGEGEEIIFEPTGSPIHRVLRIKGFKRIPASDWVNDFQPQLGLGKYLMVELPVDVDEVLKSLKQIKQKGYAERIVEASKSLESAMYQFRKGEWRHSVNEGRDITDSLKKGIVFGNISAKQALKNLIVDSGMPKEASESLVRLIDNLYAYTCAAHHAVDKLGKRIDVPAAFQKEDALFVVGTNTLLLNLLSKKLATLKCS